MSNDNMTKVRSKDKHGEENQAFLDWKNNTDLANKAVRLHALEYPPPYDFVEVSKILVASFSEKDYEISRASIGSFRNICIHQTRLQSFEEFPTDDTEARIVAMLAAAYSGEAQNYDVPTVLWEDVAICDGYLHLSGVISAHCRALRCLSKQLGGLDHLKGILGDISNYAHMFCLTCEWLSLSAQVIARNEEADEVQNFLLAVADEWPTEGNDNFNFPDGDIDPTVNPSAREWLPFDEWLKLMNSDDDTHRSRAADKPPFEPREEIVKTLTRGLFDSDLLVRLCVAEALGHFPGRDSAQALRNFLTVETEVHAWGSGCFSLGLAGCLAEDAVFLNLYASKDNLNLSGTACVALSCLAVRDFQAWFKEKMLNGNAADRQIAAALTLVFIRTWILELQHALKESKEVLNSLKDPYDTQRIEFLFDLANLELDRWW